VRLSLRTSPEYWFLTQNPFLSVSGPIPYQPAGMIPLEQVWFDAPGFHPRRHLKQDEQCLSANVFRPTNIADPSARLPVFVFI
jgi:carboxylesterase type B